MWTSIRASRLGPILSQSGLYPEGPKSATARTADRMAGAFGTNPPSVLLERCSDHSASVRPLAIAPDGPSRSAHLPAEERTESLLAQRRVLLDEAQAGRGVKHSGSG
jgi:hypothetical protein